MMWLYASNRYGTLLLSILHFFTAWNYKSCLGSIIIEYALQLVQFLCIGLFSALRVYALLDGKVHIPAIVFALNLVPFATNLFYFAMSKIILEDDICTTSLGISDGINVQLSVTVRSSAIVADVLVLLVTWYKTFHVYREARRSGIKAHLAMLLIRDGTLYFTIFLGINILIALSANIPSLFSVGLGETLLVTLGPILISRFILNLRQVNAPGSSWTSNGGEEVDNSDEQFAWVEGLNGGRGEAVAARVGTGESEDDIEAQQSGARLWPVPQ
ncbi:hypothetical protein BDY19DRAFT_960599 [Irpex rosettiformis]|uniref:Uncharacterized protein n=1 Tax=Irpex rosettiformis TaxID=378272 RepID=A0ACB8TX45_9APHY|nr:hypothetical protein BDY19DRAFT_960599 [Irpex rosettiformis]